jgi:hypothetical protein
VSEKKEEDLDRELIELLNELRVALPGVQVLFAFLLTLPFTSRFSKITDFERDVYFAAFLATAAATAFLIAPSSYHRLRWRTRDKDYMLRIANRLVICGSVFLAFAIVCTIFLISEVLFGIPTALATSIVAGGVFVWLWYGLALVRRAEK